MQYVVEYWSQLPAIGCISVNRP